MPKRFEGEKSKGLLLYSVLWVICCAVLLSNFHGKTLMWRNDGFYQHFSSFCYLCDYIKNFFVNHRLAGIFNYTLGQGLDAITTLNGYDFTDPVSFICALFFPLTRSARFTLMVFAKLYLIGFSFMFYCWSIEREEAYAAASGAIAYLFSGAILFWGPRHPNFMNWAYFLPFLLGGAELYLRKGIKAPLILFVFLNITTNYYTFFMNTVLSAVYVLTFSIWKIIREKTAESAKREVKSCVKLALVCCVGVLLSSVFLFPSVYAYLHSDRALAVTGYTESMLKYPSSYYITLFESVFPARRSPGFGTYIGLNAVMIIPLVLIFAKKGYKEIKTLLIVFLLMLCVPMAGRVMNGFGYVTNRWCYAIPFIVSVCFVVIYPELDKMSKKEKTCVYLVTLVYIACCLLHMRTNADPLKYTALLMLAFAAAVQGIAQHYQWPGYKKVITFLVLLGACYQVHFTFDEACGRYAKQFNDKDRVESVISSLTYRAAPKRKKSFYRVEKNDGHLNLSRFTGTYGTDFGWSIVPSHVMRFHLGLALDSVSNFCFVNDIDARPGLMALSSVKYYTRDKKTKVLLPYGFKEARSKDERFRAYENKFFLPIGYTYSHYIDAAELEKLNGVDREYAMLCGAVSDVPLDGFGSIHAPANSIALDYKITAADNLSVENNSIEVSDAGASMTIKAAVPADCELYLYFKNMRPKYPDLMYVKVLRKAGRYSVSKSALLTNLNFQFHALRDDVAFDLGCGGAGENAVTITFNRKAMLSYDEIKLLAVPMADYAANVKKLKKHVLKNVKVGRDRISGVISLPEKRILQISVPYSDGWKAKVDGVDTPLLRSSIMYMALPLNAGRHHIELRYRTPYLREGLAVTVITVLLWGLCGFKRKRKDKRQSNAE